MSSKRILVVDDSCMYQRLLSDVINAHPGLEVVGVAPNGRVALEMVGALKPDLITLDILMPELDGIQTLIELRKQWPDVRTVMVSSLTSEGSDAALDALALGAHDYTVKPSSVGGVGNIRRALGEDLLPKIEALCGIESRFDQRDAAVIVTARQHLNENAPARRNMLQRKPEVLLIGVSTGGPDALARLLVELPADFEIPVCIVQHMPAEFTAKLAARLDAASDLKVREAQVADKLRAGTVYIAPGNYHMVLERIGQDDVVCLNRNPPENSCRPSVDPLFRSAASIHGAQCLGVIMTGMGQDGLKGSEALFAAGSTILVQDEASSIVWGMPKLVAQAGLAEEQVPLDRLAAAILERVRGPRMSGSGAVSGRLRETADSAANAGSYQRDNMQGRSS